MVHFGDSTVQVKVEGADWINTYGNYSLMTFDNITESGPIVVTVTFANDFPLDIDLLSFDVRKIHDVFIEIFYQGTTIQEFDVSDS